MRIRLFLYRLLIPRPNSEAFESSILCIKVYRRRRFHSDVLIGSFKEERLERLLTDSYMVRKGVCNNS